MLNDSNLYIPVKKSILLLSLVLISNVSNVFSDLAHSGNSYSDTDLRYNIIELPSRLREASLPTLESLRDEMELNGGTRNVSRKALSESEEKLLDTLLMYDDIKLNIVPTIIKLIQEYNVAGKYKERLLGYCDTFSEKIKQSRLDVHSLAAYKLYSTHFSIVYVSLIYTFKENPGFYARYKRDLGDPSSTIGRYISQLNLAYKHVEMADKIYQTQLIATKNKASLDKLNREIALRQSRLNSQYSVSLSR